VQVGTANFVNPGATLAIIDGIEAYLKRHGLDDVSEIVGKLQVE
jgi:dihydroorotate dehydrogenase (NAD+) catalytic subunit